MSMAVNGLMIAIIVIAAAIASPALATDYTVGDNAGWKLGVNYTGWAAGKQFYLGDRLIFNYGQGAHNVYRVNGTIFQQCIVPPPSEALTTGNDVITLATSGRKWYICGVGKHCASGMKLAITVSSSEAPAMAPAPSATEVSGSNKTELFSFSGLMLAVFTVIMFILFNV